MFCTSLRRRPSFASVVSTLHAAPLSLNESQLHTHDLEIPFGSTIFKHTGNTLSSRRLRVLLISPAGVREARVEDTMQRILHFAALTGGQDVVILFLLNTAVAASFVTAKDFAASHETPGGSIESIRAYTQLQIEMMNHAELSGVPVLPVTKANAIQNCLQKHLATLSRTITTPKPSSSSVELLRECTATPPMSQHTGYVLSDVFPSLRKLAAASSNVTSAPNSSSPSARIAGLLSQTTDVDRLAMEVSTEWLSGDPAQTLKTLRDLVGDQECRDIVDFWKEEWTVY